MEKKQVTQEERKVLKSMFLRSHLVFTTFNMVKMEANAYTLTMAPAIESIYKDDPQEKREAYLRANQFFNTHAVPFSFIAGLNYAMEKQHHDNGSIDGTTINAIKTALMGPTAGMFDSLFFNCLRIIASGIAIGLCSQGNVLGTFLFILIYGVSQSVVKYLFVNWGYTFGTSFIDAVYNSGLMQALTKAAGVMGLMMIGFMSASTVNVPLNWTISIGETSVVVQDVLNSIFPGILGVGLLFLMVGAIKKGWRPTQLVLCILAFGLVGAFLGIF